MDSGKQNQKQNRLKLFAKTKKKHKHTEVSGKIIKTNGNETGKQNEDQTGMIWGTRAAKQGGHTRTHDKPNQTGEPTNQQRTLGQIYTQDLLH